MLLPENRLNGLQILAGLRELMRAWRPDVVHTHRNKENVLGSIANRLTHNVPSVRTVHGATEHPAFGLRQLHNSLFAKLDAWCGVYLQQRIVAVSHELAGKLAATFPAGKIVVVENGIDAESIRSQVRPLGFRTDAAPSTHMGIVGRLVPVKRVDLFLEAANALRKLQPHTSWRFHVIGDGPLHSELAARAQELGIAETVTFHGHRDDAISYIAALDVLVNCSDHEGLPMTVLEALAVGTPIVAHAVGGLGAALDESPCAELVTDHDSDSYAAAIRGLLNRATVTERSSQLQERFTAARNAQSIYRLYLELTA
jgi:glycosyltransferase involved in cell wall biosynthesis